ncbi:S8 family serine peptidase [Dokdonella sp.]|uniref:S8 family serine peptidase n=1 Tax=Dokdonella sp. TaxID=2291710 RepID=UPI003C5C4BB5
MSVSLLRHAPLALACAAAIAPLQAAEIDAGLRDMARQAGSVDTLIVLEAKAPKQLLRTDGDYLQRRRDLVDTLRATAEVSQANLRSWMDAQGITYRSYWIVNSIQATLNAEQLEQLDARTDVAAVRSNRFLPLQLPADSAEDEALPATNQANSPLAIEWGVNKVRAPEVWAMGIRGQNVVIAGQDTGYRWDHPAIKDRYRGWNGATTDHAYNWHDAVHAAGSSCGADASAPCDDHGHGTHTMGTMVGDDGAGNQVGVAPDARWVGCRNMNAGDGSPATYIECTQWFVAPTDASNQNPNSDLAPDIVNNSWGCPASEGCTTGEELREAIDNIVDAGIFFVAAAGNSGSSCSTIGDSPATYDATFTVGGTNSANNMYSGSGRGPVAGSVNGKPDVIAPGQTVRSSVPNYNNTANAYYSSLTGTSMASPHVAGAAALLMSLDASLKGNPQAMADLLRSTAVPLTSTTQVCGGIPSTTFPNPVQGHGQIDVYAAFMVAEKIFADGADD